MEQTHKKTIGYGFRGWLLILFQAIAFVMYQASTNYPLNILNGLFDGFAGGEGQGQYQAKHQRSQLFHGGYLPFFHWAAVRAGS